jgi:hypothetical protein
VLTARLRGLGTVLLDVSVSHSQRTALARELLRSNCHAKPSTEGVGTQAATEQLPCQAGQSASWHAGCYGAIAMPRRTRRKLARRLLALTLPRIVVRRAVRGCRTACPEFT